ncbi:hypothetical protein M5D96_012475, partial [Drosophila gunungcola]
ATGSQCQVPNVSGNQLPPAKSSMQQPIPLAEKIPAGLRPHFSKMPLMKSVVMIRATPSITATRTGSMVTPACWAICTAPRKYLSDFLALSSFPLVISQLGDSGMGKTSRVAANW